MRWSSVALACLLSCGCGAKTGLATNERDAATSVPVPDGCTVPPRPVDIVFVTDTSGSMQEELTALADQIPSFLLGLARPPDADRDGVPDWPAVTDLHVAVAPTGLGGAFATEGDPERPECDGSYGPYQSLASGEVERLGRAVSCVATNMYPRSDEALLGTVARALLPSGAPLRVPAGPNLGDGAHRGFLRPGSVLVVLFLSDEDDETRCTLEEDPSCEEECFSIAGGGRECFGSGRLTAYIDALRSLRRPADLLVGTLAGAAEGAATESEVLESFEGVRPTSFVCRRGLRTGLPAPRLARFTFELGGEYRSVCSESYEELTQAVVERVRRRVCVP